MVRDVSAIYVGRSAELLPTLLAGERVVVVTDERVVALHGDVLPDAPRIVMGCGEGIKNLATVEQIHRELLALGADRKSFLLAVGGGIVTDTAGFAASTYMRGVRFGFLSTTLLGQVDAALGGKNGVNIDRYKNMAGSFTQPAFVVCDPALLRTLPEREFRAGLAEVIKSAVIGDRTLFERLEGVSLDALRDDEALLAEVVRAAAGVKVAVVNRDEREQGDRRLLNLGHTVAHAIEKCSEQMNHGEAVAVGLAMVADFAAHNGLLSVAVRDRMHALLNRFGFVTAPPVAVEALIEEMAKDKKSAGAQLHLVVPREIGRCETMLVEKERLRELVASSNR